VQGRQAALIVFYSNITKEAPLLDAMGLHFLLGNKNATKCDQKTVNVGRYTFLRPTKLWSENSCAT